jgi:hypothetical protein
MIQSDDDLWKREDVRLLARRSRGLAGKEVPVLVAGRFALRVIWNDTKTKR